ncbi:MAG TPA: nuclear transport factor 2 family protein [Gemmatimonadales bacterium]|nr:nuclear transport factor 2 family protein [Gemmatimonadales bacterium]
MRGMQRVGLLMTVAAGLAAACQPAAETPQQAQARIDSESAAAKQAIDSLDAEFAKHFNMGHADVVAAFYTEQAHLMRPNAPVAVGREAIKAALNEFVPMKPELKLTAQSVVANGPVAIEQGVYAMSFTPPGAPGPINETGKYLVHWQLVDGKWLLAADIWNSDVPMAPPPPAPAAKKK